MDKFFTSKVISFSYFLNSSIFYKRFKGFFKEILNNDDSYRKKYFDIFMIFLVLSTISILIYEIKHEIPQDLLYFEYGAIIVFALEWLARVWTACDSTAIIVEDYEKITFFGGTFSLSKSLKKIGKQKLDFIISPMSIIDFLAIIPSYRPFGILRIFLLFRLFKIFRYTKSLNSFFTIFIEKRFEFSTLMMFYTFFVFFASAIIYILEGGDVNPKIETFFDAVYWSVVTIATVGYGDIVPVTTEGKFITALLIVGGFMVIVFATSIVTTAMTERLEIIKENRIKSEAQNLKDFTIICGCGVMGMALASELEAHLEKFIIIDNQEGAIIKAKSKGYLAIKGDGSNVDLLKELNISNAKALIAMTNNDATNISMVLAAKTAYDKIKVISRMNNKSAKRKFELVGVKEIVYPYELSALIGSGYIEEPISFDAIDSISFGKDNVLIDEIEINEGLGYDKKKLYSLGFEEHGIKLLGIVRNENGKLEFFFNPDKEEFAILNKDVLIVIGQENDIHTFKSLIVRDKKWKKIKIF